MTLKDCSNFKHQKLRSYGQKVPWNSIQKKILKIQTKSLNKFHTDYDREQFEVFKH